MGTYTESHNIMSHGLWALLSIMTLFILESVAFPAVDRTPRLNKEASDTSAKDREMKRPPVRRQQIQCG